jgi:hypothetical protein
MHPPRPIRPAPSALVSFWNWLFTLSIYFVLGYTAINLDKITILAQLTRGQSLFANLWLLMGAMVLILLGTSAVHEIGHLMGGKLAKFRFHLLIIGPFKMMRRKERLHLSWSRGAFFNGLAASLPEDDRQLRWRMLLFAVGGPLASLLLALLGTAVFFNYRRDIDFLLDNAWLVEGAALTAIISFIFFLTAMKPGQYNNGMPADGGRIITLLQGNETADRWCALVLLNGADILGQRPREWDAALVQKVLAITDGSYDTLSAKMLGYQWALDNGRIEDAAQLLDEALETWAAWVSGGRGRLALEKAYFIARHRHNALEARQWFDQVRRSRISQPLQQRAEAAILLAEGNHQAATMLAQAGLDALQKETPSGTILAESDWLREMVQAAQLVNE